MSGNRVPETIAVFNSYIVTTDNYLQALSTGSTTIHNWERLGLSSANASDWHTFKQGWTDTLYPKYQDPLQSTSAVKKQVRDFMTDFKEFAIPLLNIMAASPNATSDDEEVFNFKIGRAAPSHDTTPIEETVVFDAKPLGGGELKFTCRTASDTHRASLAPGADSVQLAYLIIDTGTEINVNPDEEKMIKETVTKSSFIKHAGAGNVGKTMVTFARWYNTKHPELAGPWSAMQKIIIA